MAKDIAGVFDIFLIVAGILIIPAGLLLIIGPPNISLHTSYVIVALIGFLIGILNQRYVADLIIISFIHVFFLVFLSLFLKMGWKAVSLTYLASFYISKQVTEKRRRSEYKVS